MKRVPKSAEESNAIPTAERSNNSTASTESFPDGDVSNRGGEVRKKVHSFSKKLAGAIHAKKRKLNSKAKNACHEATLLKYLAHRVSTSKHIIEGKKWFYITIEKLAEQFPYFGNTTAYDLVMSLNELGYLEIGNFNRYKYDRTLWFHVSQKVCHAAEEDLIYFGAAVAEDVGVVAAVLQRNFEYWMGVVKQEELDLEVEMSPAKLSELLPFSESSIKRGLKRLESKYFKRLAHDQPLYGILEISRGSNPNGKGPYPNDRGSNPNGIGSNPNDDTYWKPVSNPLETPSKAKPAASAFDHPAYDMKANDEQYHLFDDGIAPCADGQDREEMCHDASEQNSNGCFSSSATEQPNSFAAFEVPVSCHGTEASCGCDIHSSSTADIDGEAEDVDGKWPMVYSLEELHQINRENVTVVEKLLLQSGATETFRQTILNICAKTMGMLDADIMDGLYANPDGDEIIQELLPHFHQFLDGTSLDPSTGLTQLIYHAALECMVGAFLWPREKHDSYSHPLHSLISVTRKFYLILWRREENARWKAVEEERAQWREEFASVDEHKENDASLSPAEKMRVFRNALHTRNKMGWIFYDQTHRTNIIQVTKVGCERIQHLFAVNPELTPADLLPIMDKCMEKYCAWPVPPKRFREKDFWHSRMGHRLHMFASYLKTIVKELEMVSPVRVYLPDAKVQDEDGVALAA